MLLSYVIDRSDVCSTLIVIINSIAIRYDLLNMYASLLISCVDGAISVLFTVFAKKDMFFMSG